MRLYVCVCVYVCEFKYHCDLTIKVDVREKPKHHCPLCPGRSQNMY